jgi:hypothetical protein
MQNMKLAENGRNFLNFRLIKAACQKTMDQARRMEEEREREREREREVTLAMGDTKSRHAEDANRK